MVGTNTERRPLATYKYDNQNQLAEEKLYTYTSTNLTTTPTTTKTYAYTYDNAGNILSEKVNGTTTKTYTYGDSQWVDKLMALNGTAITYDAIGNPKSYTNGAATYALTWKNARQLATASVDGSTDYTLTFNYDLDGIRTKKVVNGVTHEYITQNGKIVRETIGSGSTAKILDFIYDESGNPCALIYTNGTATPLTYYYVLNLQGDVVMLVNANGESRAEYTYNAWGELLSSSGTMASINPLRYRGYYYDSETGWYYLQSRYYDPVLHRFINADSYASTGQGFIGTNMFAYCGNNPVANADYDGEDYECVIANESETFYFDGYYVKIEVSVVGSITSDAPVEISFSEDSLDFSVSIGGTSHGYDMNYSLWGENAGVSGSLWRQGEGTFKLDIGLSDGIVLSKEFAIDDSLKIEIALSVNDASFIDDAAYFLRNVITIAGKALANGSNRNSVYSGGGGVYAGTIGGGAVAMKGLTLTFLFM